jgi:hypothetical protein
MRRVFSMEPEGMTKFCDRKVRMKRPTTRTEQMLARASKGVSAAFSFAGAGIAFEGGAVFFDILSPADCLQRLRKKGDVMGGVQKNVPRGLKPIHFFDVIGTTKVVP